jgi:hypothetical protein
MKNSNELSEINDMNESGQAPGTESGSDRREHQRFVMLEFARLKIGEIEETSSVLVDVSLGGMQVRSRYQYQAGAIVSVTVGRGDIEPVTVQAEIRYSLPIKKSDLFATGLRIVASDSEKTRQWVAYVHEVFKQQGESLL